MANAAGKGEKSTYESNGGKKTETYVGHHRKDLTLKKVGDPKRVTDEKGGNSDRV